MNTEQNLKLNLKQISTKRSSGKNESSPPSSMHKYIGKARQLINQTHIKLGLLYPQTWHFQQGQNEPLNNNKNSQIPPKVLSVTMHHQPKNHTENQKKTYNCRYQDLYIENVDFGMLVYERFPNKSDNLWRINGEGRGDNLASERPGTRQGQKLRQLSVQRICKDHQFQFDSKFESGNLQRVYKTTKETKPAEYFTQRNSHREHPPSHYTLLLQNDTNTRGYTHWFYFRIHNILSFQTVKLTIPNILKPCPLYSRGLKITTCSTKKLLKQKIGWERSCSNIQQFCNGLVDDYGNRFYSLTFQYTFEYANDDVYFAYCYPYSYEQMRENAKEIKDQGLAKVRRIGLTVLKNQIIVLEQEEKKKVINTGRTIDSDGIFQPNKSQGKGKRIGKKLERNSDLASRFLGRTECQGKTNMMTISESNSGNKLSSMKKPIILIMARAHPSQTVSSFVMQGIIQNIFYSEQPQCKYISSKCSMRLIPMINPDGVIHGNSRTSAAGFDLNRRWDNPNPILHPQVYSIKRYIDELITQGHTIFAIVDLHGHSKKQSSFFYGSCESRNYHNHSNIRLFNAIMSRLESNFSRQHSSFYVSNGKVGTARVACCRNYTPYSYTLECSFLGSRDSQNHYTPSDYKCIGKNLVRALAYFHQSLNPMLTSAILGGQVREQLLIDKAQIEKQKDQLEDDSGGSSSNPSLYNYSEEFIATSIVPNCNRSLGKTRYDSLKLGHIKKEPRLNFSNQDGFKMTKKPSRQFTVQKVPYADKKLTINQKDFSKADQKYESAWHMYNFKSRRVFSKKKNSVLAALKLQSELSSLL